MLRPFFNPQKRIYIHGVQFLVGSYRKKGSDMFEDLLWVMAKHDAPSVPDSPGEWLEQFNTFSIYQVLPQLIELSGLNVQTDLESKKPRKIERENFEPSSAVTL